MKLQTNVLFAPSRVSISYSSKVMVLGSCFADEIGKRMQISGIEAMVNPFGTLYNPISLANAVARLSSANPFREEECVMMGSGSGLICSFSHHTSFARPTAAEFLEHANSELSRAAEFWKEADRVIITLGTSLCYTHDGEVVANCLKRDGREFERIGLSSEKSAAILGRVIQAHPDKSFILTVSPVRHLGDGTHVNTLSKASLLLAAASVCDSAPNRCDYFPAFEIMMDELRDYRFYSEDMAHPTAQAAQYIWERFMDFAVPRQEHDALKLAEKAWRASQHRQMH